MLEATVLQSTAGPRQRLPRTHCGSAGGRRYPLCGSEYITVFRQIQGKST